MGNFAPPLCNARKRGGQTTVRAVEERRIAVRLLVTGILAPATLACATIAGPRSVEAGFWLDTVSYDLTGSGGPVTTGELAVIERAALDEIRRAFAGLAIRFSPSRDTRYAVIVVQHLYDLRVRRTSEVFGNARAMRGLGGRGAVNFYAVASAADAYAPENATRDDVIEAIGRGVGRVAIHEFTHLFLPRTPIHASDDPLSYEYGHAARREQYYGELRWGFARAALVREYGPP
jgi:hypothetical protein